MRIFNEIRKERLRQGKKWGEQNHKPIEWIAILTEEVGEAIKEAVEYNFRIDKLMGIRRLQNYRKELIQIAAVAVEMIESLERNELKEKTNE